MNISRSVFPKELKLYLLFSVLHFVFLGVHAQGGGHRTLLYGHAVLLRHSYSGMVRKASSISTTEFLLDQKKLKFFSELSVL